VIDQDDNLGRPVLRYLSTPLDQKHEPYIRFNDGGCDSRGRFFAGTLASNKPPINGQLWRYDPAAGTTILIDDKGITDGNGLGWTQDDKTFYFTNSLKNEILAYDYDIETGEVTNRRVHLDTSRHGLGSSSFPDGLCLDSEGGIWTAQWAGSKVARFAPDGVYDLEISIPKAWHVTACCFGGPDLDQLYITSASALCPGGDPTVTIEENTARQTLYPDSGNLFVVDLKGEFQGAQARHDFLH